MDTTVKPPSHIGAPSPIGLRTSGASTEEARRIIYLLGLLNFIRPQDISDNELLYLTEYINTHGITIPTQLEISDIDTSSTQKNIILDVPDGIISLCLLRSAALCSQDGQSIIYNKRRFKFHNVYNNDSYDEMVAQTLDFINRRVLAQKPSTLLYMGYSGSGKSTLCGKLIDHYTGYNIRYKLYEIYNNKYYILYNGTKSQVDNVTDKKYEFSSCDIMGVIERFARKRATSNNSRSSRAHTVLECYISGVLVRFVDVCGNEKLQDTEKSIKDETLYINGSTFNMLRYLTTQGNFKVRGCLLTNLIKDSKNILTTTILNDIPGNLACNTLMMLKDFLKTLVYDIFTKVEEILDEAASYGHSADEITR
jgi:hypothetical protein